MSKERLFGTDGVRGVANKTLTASLALQLGMAAGCRVRLARQENTGAQNGGEAHESARPVVVVGRDTRLSGDMLEAALASGLAAMGADVVLLGVVPTPAVAQVVLARGAEAGVVISASHNPYEDNGIKFFGPNGKKLPDCVEAEMEETLAHLETLARPSADGIGRIVLHRDWVNDYVERTLQTVPDSASRPLSGLRLLVDCANGAAYELAPRILRALGADITPLYDTPNGVNINLKCGSTHPQEMAARVREGGYHAGLAFDGDADRVILADENGDLVDGDRIMAIIALHRHAQGRLPGNVVVSTIMSNVGLEQALEAKGIRLERTSVGDRYVAEAMDRLGAAVGGEQSGHVLLPDITPTGDGLVTALQVLIVMHSERKPLSELAGVVQSCPQLLKNVRVQTRQGWDSDPDIQQAIARGSVQLGRTEWLSVRPSGTEPLIRVMAQGTDSEVVQAVVHDICAVVEKKLGRNV